MPIGIRKNKEELVLKDYKMTFVYLIYILYFLFGALVSSLVMEWVSRYKQQATYVIPVFIEIFLLFKISFSTFLFVSDCFPYSILLTSVLLLLCDLSYVSKTSRTQIQQQRLADTLKNVTSTNL